MRHLTTAQKLERALNQLVTKEPFWGTLALGMKREITDTLPSGAPNPTAATNGHSTFWNAEFIETLSEDELLGVDAHETGHPALGHHVRRGERDPKLWNIAADYELNPILVKAGFTLPAGALLDSRFANMSAESIYNVLEREQRQQGKQGGQGKPQQGKPQSQQGGQGNGKSGQAQSQQPQPGQGAPQQTSQQGAPSQQGGQGGQPQNQGAPQQGSQGSQQGSQQASQQGGQPQPGQGNAQGGQGNGQAQPGDCGQVLDAPGNQAEQQASAAKWEANVRQAVAIAAKAGKGHGGIEALAKAVGKPRLDLKETVRRFMDDSTSRDYSWSRPNRRFASAPFVMPGFVPDRPSHIVIMIDSSGSMDESRVAELTGEAQAALDDGAADRITLAYADTDVGPNASYVPGDVITLQGAPRGGTCFRQPMQWIAETCPDASAILYMTDMETSDFGDEPACPVLWLVTGYPEHARRAAALAPFGESIILED